MKKKQRKSYTAAFKVKIALEAIKGQRTINEIATHYDVHPNQVTQWTKQGHREPPEVFPTPPERQGQGERASQTQTQPQDRQAKSQPQLAKKKSWSARLIGSDS